MSAKSQIRVWREGAGLKQKWVAEQMGVHVRTLQGWESGKHTPSIPNFTKLMGILRVPETEWPGAMGGVAHTGGIR